MQELRPLLSGLAKSFFRSDLFWVFILAIIIRISLLSISWQQVDPAIFLDTPSDVRFYVSMAKDLLNGTDYYSHGFFYFGPGYASFLASIFYIFGESPLPALLIQIVLSSLSCLLLYHLAFLLIEDRKVAIIAGILSAVSSTSASLSCLLLSDTFYFFLTLSSIVLFVHSLRSKKILHFASAGAILGLATLTKSIGQFVPLLLFASGVLYQKLILEKSTYKKILVSSLTRKSAIFILIAISITSVWVVRNYFVVGTASVAMTSAAAPANIARQVLANKAGKTYNQFGTEWTNKTKDSLGVEQLTLRQQFEMFQKQTTVALSEYPLEYFKTHLDVVWENVTETNVLLAILLPNNKLFIAEFDSYYKKRGFKYIFILLSLAGVVVLLLRKQYWPALLLLSLLLYFGLLCGFRRWQGSRLFFPGQIAETILAATALVSFYSVSLEKLNWKKYLRRKTD